ncbi:MULTISPECIES: S8 family serine peptidase [unclassified Sutcliffiella]|uniref:S8 family serine peptidase n=1 Tax=unclassified Sutcliffiella TaxID=2837532 RepID=UPI0030D181C4
MKKEKYFRRICSSLLIFLLVFSLFAPTVGANQAQSTNSLKDQLSSEAASEMKNHIAQQKAAIANRPSLHADLKNLKGDKEISVIVQLDELPVAMVKGINKLQGKSFSKASEQGVKNKVAAQHKKFEKELSKKGIKAKVGFTFDSAINGLVLTLKESDVEKLTALEGVVLVEPDLEVQALSNPENTNAPNYIESVNHLDVPAVWDMGYEGENVKVAVLDTGIDYNHPDFEGVYKGGFNFVPHTTGYARDRAFDDPYETSPLDRPDNRAEFNANGSSFYTTHGTHVAGTIAAQGKNPYGMIGLAPKIDLYAYRVLGAYGSGATSGIIAGIDKSVEEGMDIINLSLGGSSNSQIASDAIAINNAAMAGVTAVIATGNSGPNRGTIGNPATAAFGIAVGNSTVKEDVIAATGTSSVGSTTTTSPLKLMAWEFGTRAEDKLSGGAKDLVAIGGWGEPKDYVNKDVNGKIAVVSRGTTPFVDKVAAAKAEGAAGIIIYNNAAGHIKISLGDGFDFIPTFDMTREAGLALVSALNANSGEGTVNFQDYTYDKTAGDEMNSSSSRGPANPVFDIKPDVSAPGTNILSTVPAYAKDYPNADYTKAFDRYTGTSMATPHIAGVAALLKSQHPDWTPFDIKVALSNTAKQLDTTRFDVFAQGPGRVQPLKAATTEALAYAQDKTTYGNVTRDNVKGTITFGNVPTGSATTITKDVVVKNLTGNASDYDVTVQVTKAATGSLAATNVTVDQSSFTLTDQKTLKVSLNVPAGTGSNGNEILGYVHINNGTTKLILPFAANFAPPTGLKSFSLDHNDISPNNDGLLDSTTVRYEFWNQQGTTYIELWDASNPEGGFYGDGYLGYLLATNRTTTGMKTLAFNGRYTPWGSTGTSLAPDGVYTIDITTASAFAWTGPVYIKTTKPVIQVNNSYTVSSASYELSASINDSYIDFKSTVEEIFGQDYDVNEKLTVEYELTNSNGEKVGIFPVELDQDGAFTTEVTGLTLGENTVKLSVVDEAQNRAEKTFTITRVDEDAPVTEASLEGQAGQNGWYISDVKVNLHATDADSEIVSTQYRVNDGEWKSYNGPFTLQEEGENKVEYRSEDAAGNVEGTKTVVVKIDKTAPKLSVKVDKEKLFPPNNKLETIKATLDYSDAHSGIASVTLKSITINEQAPEADIQGASFGTEDTEFQVRASRNGNGKGRVYTITYLATDNAGNTVEATATVTVPHDNGKKNN